MKKLKKLQNYFEELIFGQNFIKILALPCDGCHGNVKSDRHTIDISKFPQTMNELSSLLKVSSP